MLLRFSAANFLSIDGELELSLVATRETQHGKRLAETKAVAHRLLQAAAIWGGNAAGKSNLCKVLEFAQRLIVKGTRPDASTGRIPFRLRENAGKEPTRLSFDILLEIDGKERAFRYAFAVGSREVVEEALTEIRPSSERVYFTRSAGTGGRPDFSLDAWARPGVADDDRQFARFVAKGTAPNQLFLHEAMDRNLGLLAPVFRWFRDQLIVLEPGAPYLPLELEGSNRQDLRDYTVDLLSRAGTGVTGVEPREQPLANSGIGAEMAKELGSLLADDDTGIMLRGPRGERVSVFRKEGELVASRIVTRRLTDEGREVHFETVDESDGTLRLLDLAPILHDLERPGARRTYVIDELDRSMHNQLTEALLQHYLTTRSSATRTQLVFTTHDLQLMDQRLLRRDEIWLIERGPHGETLLESLADYQGLRADRDIRKAYLDGRFSGIPHLAPLRARGRRASIAAVEGETQPSGDPVAVSTDTRGGT
ncbi:MAG: ATP-binding protein [Candidatus Accumulibacter similis]|nr:MAG: ATP-binding protein [Candidatus Accumulibacter similis]